MFPARSAPHATLVAVLVGTLLVGLLPATALAVGPVIAVDDVKTIAEDEPSPIDVDVLANDDFTIGGATITAVTQGTLGLVAIPVGGLSVLYTPDVNAN